MNRRDILRAMALGGGVVAGELWIPGRRAFSIPRWTSPSETGYFIDCRRGNDITGDGSRMFPWASFRRLEGAPPPLRARTWVTVAPGEYHEDVVIPAMPGGAPTVLKADGEMTIVDVSARPYTAAENEVAIFGRVAQEEAIRHDDLWTAFPGHDHGDRFYRIIRDPVIPVDGKIEFGTPLELPNLRFSRGGH